MFDIKDSFIKDHIFDGNFGLEKENLRINENAGFPKTRHSFLEDENISRDFCENQIEINTGVHDSIKGAVDELSGHEKRVCERISKDGEYLWYFSNPPYIADENDIPIAIFEGEKANKTEYRKYLSKKYGRHKMTFSGIHFNFSFSEELIKRGYELTASNEVSYKEYKNAVYLKLAKKMALYAWLMVAVTAASPVIDGSFIEPDMKKYDVFSGIASYRCSESGYWNEFTPVFDYTSALAYTNSIKSYIDSGLLIAPSELYYPIRLKPRGENDLDRLGNEGVDHIELRMIDLNPFEKEGLNIKDLRFAHLLMLYTLLTQDMDVSEKDQIRAVLNYKNAAKYYLEKVNVIRPDGEMISVKDAALDIIGKMKAFFSENDIDTDGILEFEEEKFLDPDKRYANRVRQVYGCSFVEKGLELSKARLKESLVKS